MPGHCSVRRRVQTVVESANRAIRQMTTIILISYMSVMKSPTTISVDDIRTQLNNDIVIKPYSSKYKIYIVDEAEK